jgi:hypothetical protein
MISISQTPATTVPPVVQAPEPEFKEIILVEDYGTWKASTCRAARLGETRGVDLDVLPQRTRIVMVSSKKTHCRATLVSLDEHPLPFQEPVTCNLQHLGHCGCLLIVSDDAFTSCVECKRVHVLVQRYLFNSAVASPQVLVYLGISYALPQSRSRGLTVSM